MVAGVTTAGVAAVAIAGAAGTYMYRRKITNMNMKRMTGGSRGVEPGI